MALAKSNTNDLASLFKEGFFKIPSYQRKFSWRDKQIDDLFNDLYEGFKTKAPHFLGTLSLQKTKDEGLQSYYEIIDGQQRFTTIVIFFNVLARAKKQEEASNRYLRALKIEDKYFLEPIDEIEKIFFYKILDGRKTSPLTTSQKLMYSANSRLEKKVQNSCLENEEIDRFLNYILNQVHFLIYLVDDISEAIRMFEIINDRGLPLNYFDKIKSFFMYYSNKYLDNALNSSIEEQFMNIYKFFDNKNISMNLNTDETLLLQHYLSNPGMFKLWSYTKATNDIYLDMKKNLTEMAQSDIEQGAKFIENYLEDIGAFIDAIYSIESKIKRHDSYSEFYLYLNPEKRMYPLSIRLEIKGLLDQTIRLLESIEFHLKHRKNPKKDIFNLLIEIINFDGEGKELIKTINNKLFKIWTHQESVSDLLRNADWASKYVLYQYNKKKHNQKIAYEEYKKIEIEHVFPQNISFDPREYGFNEKSYEEWNDRLGNLVLLEKNINIDASNTTPDNKISKYYINSDIISTNGIQVTSKALLIERTKELEEFADDYFTIEEA